MQRLSLPLRGGQDIAYFRQFHAAPAAMLPLLIRRTVKELMEHDFKDWAFGYVACVGRASPGSSSARRGSNQVVREDLPGRLLESKEWKRRDIFLDSLLFVRFELDSLAELDWVPFLLTNTTMMISRLVPPSRMKFLLPDPLHRKLLASHMHDARCTTQSLAVCTSEKFGRGYAGNAEGNNKERTMLPRGLHKRA